MEVIELLPSLKVLELAILAGARVRQVLQLQDQRPARDDALAAGQEVPAGRGQAVTSATSR